MFRIKWLRKLIRKNTNPIPVDVAGDWRLRLSRIYAFLAANVAILIVYTTYKEDVDIAGRKNDPALTQAKRFSYLSQGKPIEVIEVKGLTVTKQYQMPAEETLKPPSREQVTPSTE